MEIEWNAGKALSLLEKIKDQRIGFKVANAMAQSYRNDTREFIDEGNSYREKTGRIKNSIFWSFDGKGAQVGSYSPRALYVDQGTRSHLIRIKHKKILSFISGNKRILTKKVNHPGSTAYPFFFSDLSEREKNMMEIGLSILKLKLELDDIYKNGLKSYWQESGTRRGGMSKRFIHIRRFYDSKGLLK